MGKAYCDDQQIEWPPKKSAKTPPKQEVITAKQIIEERRAQLIERMGTKEALISALGASQSDKAQRFLELLIDPAKQRTGISKLAQQAGLAPLDLANILRSWFASEALHALFMELPEIHRDIAKDARSYHDFCSTCGGKGSVILEPEAAKPRASVCVRCDGTGVIQKPGDSDARKYVGEATGQIKARQGVNVQVNVSSVGVDSLIDDLERDSGRTIDISSENE